MLKIPKFKRNCFFTTINNLKSRKVPEKLHMTHNSKEDFHHLKVPPNFPLHVLYRLKNPKYF